MASTSLRNLFCLELVLFIHLRKKQPLSVSIKGKVKATYIPCALLESVPNQGKFFTTCCALLEVVDSKKVSIVERTMTLVIYARINYNYSPSSLWSSWLHWLFVPRNPSSWHCTRSRALRYSGHSGDRWWSDHVVVCVGYCDIEGFKSAFKLRRWWPWDALSDHVPRSDK